VKPSTDQPLVVRLLRGVISMFLTLCVFVILLRVADSAHLYLVHSGILGLPVLAVLIATFAVAYAAFFGIIYFASGSRRPLICHGFAAAMSVLWLAFELAWSTPTEIGYSFLLRALVV
jgi:hypothetical protein